MQKRHLLLKLWYSLSNEEMLYSWVGHGLQGGPTLAVLLWLSNFKTKTSFGFLIKKSGVDFFHFFEKSKNELVRPKMMFLAVLAKIRSFFDTGHMPYISDFAIYERITNL